MAMRATLPFACHTVCDWVFSLPYLLAEFCLWCWQEPDLVRLLSEEEGSNRLNDTPDLLILSNDIPASPAEELVITGEDEDDPGQYLLYFH